MGSDEMMDFKELGLKIKLYNENCEQGLSRIADNSVDCVLTDPPYLYLKHKLDRPFDEEVVFNHFKRILKPTGFVVMFGRGTSFYRWNTMLADLGFEFKEEVIWNKRRSTSPLMRISRTHETVSLYTKESGSINKVKIPYLEMKQYDINSIVTDVKRLNTVFNSPRNLQAVQTFLESNKGYRDTSDEYINKEGSIQNAKKIEKENRCVSVMRSIRYGMNEKTIIEQQNEELPKIKRYDRQDNEKFTKHHITSDTRKTGNRCCNVMQSIEFGMNEKTIIEEGRDHFTSIHPTQKPVRLLERLLALVTKEGDVVVDPFSGSGSTAIACHNIGREFVGFEIDEEYFNGSVERIKKDCKVNLFS